MAREKRENYRPLEELEALVTRVVGAPYPDRIVAWLGVGKRNAERWITGDSTYPPAVIAKLEELAPLMDEWEADMQEMLEHFKSLGVPENLLKLRIREFARQLSDEPPPKPGLPLTDAG